MRERHGRATVGDATLLRAGPVGRRRGAAEVAGEPELPFGELVPEGERAVEAADGEREDDLQHPRVRGGLRVSGAAPVCRHVGVHDDPDGRLFVGGERGCQPIVFAGGPVQSSMIDPSNRSSNAS